METGKSSFFVSDILMQSTRPSCELPMKELGGGTSTAYPPPNFHRRTDQGLVSIKMDSPMMSDLHGGSSDEITHNAVRFSPSRTVQSANLYACHAVPWSIPVRPRRRGGKRLRACESRQSAQRCLYWPLKSFGPVLKMRAKLQP